MKFVVVFLAVLAAAAARPNVLAPLAYVAPVVPGTGQYHSQDSLGQYAYGYATDQSAKNEFRAFDGTTHGAYSYIDPEGKLQSVTYTADAAHGFRATGTNIPVAPEAPKEEEPIEEAPVENPKEFLKVAVPVPVPAIPKVITYAAPLPHLQPYVYPAYRFLHPTYNYIF